MAIEVSPEIQAMIDKDVARGRYRSATEFVELAVQMLHAQLATNREDIARKIEVGWAQAERGELLDEDEVRRDLEEKKREWLVSRRKA
jgi:Arc/MetJ-type ribon-helix-helix transcriptional regulator